MNEHKPRVLRVLPRRGVTWKDDWYVVYTLEGSKPKLHYWLISDAPDALGGAVEFIKEWGSPLHRTYKSIDRLVDDGKAVLFGFESLEHMRNELLGGE